MRNNCINNALFGRFWKLFPVSCSAIGFVIRIELVYIQLQCEIQIYSSIVEPVQTIEIMCIIEKIIVIIVVQQPMFFISILHAHLPVAADALPVFLAPLDSFLCA